MMRFMSPAPDPHKLVRALAHARKQLLAGVGAAAAAPDACFAVAFVRMVAEVEAGFRHEETLMERAGFAGLREQRCDNALLLSALHHALPRVEAGDLAIGRAVVAALTDLLSLHRFNSLRVLAAQHRGAGLRRKRCAGLRTTTREHT